MARVCLVCSHPRRVEIDQRLVDNEPYRSIAKRFCIGESAVFRHQKRHVAASLMKAKQAAEEADAQTLLDRVLSLLADAQRVTEHAEKAKQLDVALRGIREVRGCLQLLGQVSGELKQITAATTNSVTNLVVALRTFGPDELTEALRAAGHGGWMPYEEMTPEQNEARIAQLIAKGGGIERFAR